MEIVLPKLAKVITLWEFLMMKVEKGEPMRPRVDDVYREYVSLTHQVQKMCKSFLVPVKEEEEKADGDKSADRLEVSGLLCNVGKYEIICRQT